MEQKKIYYKSDFIIDITCEVGWATPFILTFFADKTKNKQYSVGWDGTTWDGCRLKETDPTILEVGMDDHGLGIGTLYMEMHYMSDNSLMKTGTYDMYNAPQKVTTKVNDVEFEVVLDSEGDDAATVIYELPMEEAEAERQANELQRISNESSRVTAEVQRVEAEKARQSAWTTLKSTIETWYTNIKSTVETWFTTTKSAWDTFNTSAQEAETLRSNAEATRISNETTRQNQETSRTNAETTRQSNEQTRVTNETSRVSAESKRVTEFAEIEASAIHKSQVTEIEYDITVDGDKAAKLIKELEEQETARQSAWATLKSTIETWYSNTQTAWNTWFTATKDTWSSWLSDTKSTWSAWLSDTKSAWDTFNTSAQEAETSRNSAESTRVSNEQTRQSNETSRSNAETTRQSNEQTRQTNETTRQTNETSRVSAESSRVTEFEAIKSEAILKEVVEEIEYDGAVDGKPVAELKQQLSAEITARQEADASEATARANADASEATARQAADATLQANIDKKQDTISDLATIRTNATAGAALVGAVPYAVEVSSAI